MTTYFIATISIKDAEKFQEYVEKFPPTIAPFQGELVIRGKAEKALAGDINHQVSAVIKFPDMRALDGWFNSDMYQALIPLRKEAAKATIIAYEAMD